MRNVAGSKPWVKMQLKWSYARARRGYLHSHHTTIEATQIGPSFEPMQAHNQSYYSPEYFKSTRRVSGGAVRKPKSPLSESSVNQACTHLCAPHLINAIFPTCGLLYKACSRGRRRSSARACVPFSSDGCRRSSNVKRSGGSSSSSSAE